MVAIKKGSRTTRGLLSLIYITSFIYIRDHYCCESEVYHMIHAFAICNYVMSPTTRHMSCTYPIYKRPMMGKDIIKATFIDNLYIFVGIETSD